MYNEGLAEEAAFLLAEHLVSPPVHGSIGFPEMIVPVVLLLRKAIKGAKGAQGKGTKAKEAGLAKVLVERVEESAKWAEQNRKGVSFAPGRLAEVERWEEDAAAKTEDTPLGRYVRVQRKAREKRRKLVEKVRLCSFFVVRVHSLSTVAGNWLGPSSTSNSRTRMRTRARSRGPCEGSILQAADCDCSPYRHGRVKPRSWRTELQRRLG